MYENLQIIDARVRGTFEFQPDDVSLCPSLNDSVLCLSKPALRLF